MLKCVRAIVAFAVLFTAGCTYNASINPRSPTSSGAGLELARLVVGTRNVYPQTRISILNGTVRKVLIDGQGFPSGRVLPPGARAEVVFHGVVHGGEARWSYSDSPRKPQAANSAITVISST